MLFMQIYVNMRLNYDEMSMHKRLSYAYLSIAALFFQLIYNWGKKIKNPFHNMIPTHPMMAIALFSTALRHK